MPGRIKKGQEAHILRAATQISDAFEPRFQMAAQNQRIIPRHQSEMGGAMGMSPFQGPNTPDEIWLATPKKDIAVHEVAHRVDEVSKSDEFQSALRASLEHEGPEDKAQYETSLELMQAFPGVLGNPKAGSWGGPEELFATLMAHSEGDITRIPPPLRRFFAPFLGPELTRSQQAQAARMFRPGE